LPSTTIAAGASAVALYISAAEIDIVSTDFSPGVSDYALPWAASPGAAV
jgi:hypothetical protein